MLTYIETSKIIPHPDNPRKDLGDLAELAESIKTKGILQNLTVVPLFDEFTADGFKRYRVVIGHRRLAAAKLAGLKEVPCVYQIWTTRSRLLLCYWRTCSAAI